MVMKTDKYYNELDLLYFLIIYAAIFIKNDLIYTVNVQ
jgi:hypothetical protein